MSRQVQVVVLCEDGQHEAFLRRFLESAGWSARKLRIEKSPKGRQSGAQWVIDRYAGEVAKLRAAPHVARALVVAIDEDTLDRKAQLDSALERAGMPARKASDPILHVVPARNIETWLTYLAGEEVDATTEYRKLIHERDCKPMVTTLKAMCDAQALRQPAPPSLAAACIEYRQRLA